MMVKRTTSLYVCLSLATALLSSVSLWAQEWKSGVEWREPPVVTPGASNHQPPSDAIILFDGTNLSQWKGGENWLIEDGVATAHKGGITTKRKFGDMQLHLEWSAPSEIEGDGQGRGNSGVYLMDHYEVQILDSYQNQTYFDGQAATIYKQTPPLANAMRRPGEWNTYDIIFNAPKFRVNGDVETPAFVTVLHNGVLVLNNFEILGDSGYTKTPRYTPHAEKLPFTLQFHSDPVRFRNIWVREISSPSGRRVSPPFNIVKKQPPKKAAPAKKDKE